MARRTMSVSVDDKLYNASKQLLEGLGLNMTTAVNIFLTMCLQSDGLPFEVTYRKFNGKTEQVIQDADTGAGLSMPYSNTDDLLEALNA